MSMRLTVGLLLPVAAILSSCSIPKMVPVNVEEKGNIAVVGYSLNQSVEKCDEEKSSGPGLLQNKEKYYENHVKAVNDLWGQFKENIKPQFGNAQFVDFPVIEQNQEYLELTKHVPKMVLGKDVTMGSDEICPLNINYVSVLDSAKLNKVAKIFNAGLLMYVEINACYEPSVAIGIGPIKPSGTAKLKVTATVHLYEPGKGVVLSSNFTDYADQSVPLIAGVVTPDDTKMGEYMTSAQAKIFPKIKSYIEAEKQKALAQPKTSK
jgi:hypothetical protein